MHARVERSVFVCVVGGGGEDREQLVLRHGGDGVEDQFNGIIIGHGHGVRELLRDFGALFRREFVSVGNVVVLRCHFGSHSVALLCRVHHIRHTRHIQQITRILRFCAICAERVTKT